MKTQLRNTDKSCAIKFEEEKCKQQKWRKADFYAKKFNTAPLIETHENLESSSLIEAHENLETLMVEHAGRLWKLIT